MQKAKLFQYAVIFNPTDKQRKDDGLDSKLVVPIDTVLAMDIDEVKMMAAMAIPQEYKTVLSQLEIAARPF